MERTIFEISDEPKYRHSAQVQALGAKASAALNRGDLETAEQALLAALRIEPDVPDLLNNLMALRRSQGRDTEAQALHDDLRRRFPDYPFGCINEANLLLGQGKAAEALEVLKPLLRTRRLHPLQYAWLCSLHVRALLMLGQLDGARSWFEMLQRQIPDHPLAPSLRKLLREAERLGAGRILTEDQMDP